MRIALNLLAVVLLISITGCNPADPVSISDRPVSQNQMPRINLKMPPTKPLEKLGWTKMGGNGDEIMEDYKGKVLILDFWATYCPPCIKAIPHLRELDKKYGEDLVVIGLHVGGNEDRPRVPSFEKMHNIDYLIATPDDELTYLLLGNDNRIPQTLVFDREGKLVRQFVSYDDEIKKQLDAVVEKTVGE